jgi:hypothetical protein
VYEIEKPDNSIWEMDEMIDFVAANQGNEYYEIDELHKFVVNLSGKTILDDDFSMVKIILKEN